MKFQLNNYISEVENPLPIYILAVTQTIVWAGLYYIFPALLAKWELNLGFSKTELTSAFTTAILISSVLAPIVGRQIDKGHGQIILIGSTILGASALFYLSFISSFLMFYLSWCVIGVALSGCLYEPCFAYVTKQRGEKSVNAIILITLFAGFAGTISYPVANIIADLSNWQISLRFFSIIILIFVTPLLFLATNIEKKSLINSIPKSIKQIDYKIKNDLLNLKFVFLFIAFTTLAIAHGSVVTHIIPLLLERQIQPGNELLISSLMGPMQVLGRIIMIVLQKKNLSINIISNLTFILKIVGIICLLIADNNLYMLLLFVMFQGSGAGMTSISRAVVTANIMGYDRFASISGVMAVGFIGGAALAPILGAQLWEIGGYDLMLKIVLIILTLGLANYLAALKLNKI